MDAFTPVEPDLLAATFTVNNRQAFANTAWMAVFGGQGDPWFRLSEDDTRLINGFITEAASGNLVTSQLFTVPIPDRDQPLPVLLNFLPVQIPGDDGKLQVVAVTVTGEVLANPESWTASQTQRHRLATLGRMTMGIAHDFNNLLSGILGYSELMKNMLSEATGVGEQFGEHLRTIEQAALDGATLVRKIQQYLRQEKRSRFEPIALPMLIEDCIALTRPYWQYEPRRHGIVIETECNFSPVPPVLGSAAELREVFVNMILNAVQAMPMGGSLQFGIAAEPERGIVVTVTDTGIGMSEAVRTRIFEPLFTTKGEHGSGMGLAVSYGILKEHDASISVTSKMGRGTRFEIIFPPAPQERLNAQAPSRAVGGRPGRLLVVDDDEMVRSVLVRLLTLKKHSVRQASSGAEALKILEHESFDVLFTDHGMPEMNGRQLARLVRARYPRLPIILLTGDTEAGDVDESIDVVLSKPFKLDFLEETIQKLLPEEVG